VGATPDMSHLPTAVVFVMDLSDGAGDKYSNVVDPLILWREVMTLFSRRPWVDDVSSGFGDRGSRMEPRNDCS
jgi:hypothetical protein